MKIVDIDQKIEIEEINLLAEKKFGDLIKAVVDIRREKIKAIVNKLISR